MAWSVSNSATGQASAPAAPPVPRTVSPPPKQNNGLADFWGNVQQFGVGAVNVHNVLQFAKDTGQSIFNDAKATVTQTIPAIFNAVKDQSTANTLIDSANKGTKFLQQQLAQKKITLDQFNQGMTQINKALDYSSKTLKNGEILKLDPAKAAAQAAMTFLNIAPIGEATAAVKDIVQGLGETAIKQAASDMGSQVIEKAAPTAAERLVGTLAKEGATGSVYGSLGPLAQKGSKASQSEVVKSTVLGAGIGGALGLGGEAINAGASKAASVLKGSKAVPTVTTALDPELKDMTDGKVTTEKASNLKIGSDALGEGSLDNKSVSKYISDIKAGKPINPVVVTREKGGTFVQDGAHRLEAMKQLGIKDIPTTTYKSAAERTGKAAETTVAETKPILKTAKQLAREQTQKQTAKEEAASKLAVSASKNQEDKSILGKLSSKVSHNIINPARSAANRGNTEFVNRVSQAINESNLGAKQAKDFGAELNKNVTDHAATIKEIESGGNESKAAKLFNEKAGSNSELAKTAQKTGVVKGLQKNYFPRFAEFPKNVGNKVKTGISELFNKSGVSRGGALSKTISSSKRRALQDVIDENGNVVGKELKYKTHGEFVKAAEAQGGHVVTNVGAAGEKYYANMTRAIANAKLFQDLKTTAMADGDPAVVTLSKGLMPPEYRLKGYTTLNGVEGYAIHPEAKPLLNALANGAKKSDNILFESTAWLNSLTKHLVTLNGVVHLKNEALASIRNQGVFNTLKAMTFDMKSPEAQSGVERAIEYGYLPNSLNKMSLYDELNKSMTQTSTSKIAGTLSKPQEAMSKFIFETFGDRTGLSTYLNTEKKLLGQGFSQEEAGKIAANRANDTIFAVPPQERSIVMKNASRLALFAGQYFQRTIKIGTEAIGVGTDRTLSAAGQRASQKLAIQSLSRGAAQLFVAAQAINYATTGHSTFQNSGDKLDPVLYVDKATGKEYHATNFYGQLGEVLKLVPGPTFDMSSITNKLAPGMQTFADLISNYDQYSGGQVYNRNDPNYKQALDMFGEVLKNTVTPMGFNLSGQGIDKTLTTPLGVNAARMLGYGTSTNNRNSFQNDIYNRYVSTLPQGSQQATLQDMQLSNLKAAARNDLQKGKTDTANIKALESQMTASQFKSFLKTGAVNDTQRYFDLLPNEQKLQVIENNSPSDLKTLDYSGIVKSLFGSRSSSTLQTLAMKGFSVQRIQGDLKKVGINVGS